MKSVYIDGNVLARYMDDFVYKSITMYSSTCPEDAFVIKPDNGVLVIDSEFGCPSCDFYVTGGITFHESRSEQQQNISEYIKNNIYQLYIKSSEKLDLIRQLLDVDVKDDMKMLLYQEQYLGVFSVVEYFLYRLIFVAIRNEKLYNNFFVFDYTTVDKKLNRIHKISNIVLNNDTDMDKFRGIVNVIKDIIYHMIESVVILYKIVFGIDCKEDLLLLDGRYIEKRNHLTHRLGYDKNFNLVLVTKQEVETLINEANNMCTAIYNKVKAVVDN